METLFWSLTAAFIIAMTTLAYRKPSEYQRLVGYVLLLFMIVGMAGLVYAAGYMNGASDASRHFNADPKSVWFDGGPYPFNAMTGIFSLFGLGIYLLVLTALPQILGQSEDRPKDPPEEKS